MNTIFRKSLRGLCALFLALVLIFQAVPLLGGDGYDHSGHTAYAAADCGISTCTCASCGWTYTYRSTTSTQHFTHVKCTGCSASYGLQWENHSFSGNTCTVCGYTKSGGGETVTPGCSHGSYSYSYEYTNAQYHYYVQTCRYCGEETNAWLESHTLAYNRSYLNTAYHTYDAYCTGCGYTISSGTEAHTWSYSYSPYSSTQHSISMFCYGCGYSTTSYGNHADSNGDGACDACGYNMAVTVTWNAGTNGGTVNGSSSVTTSAASGSVASPPSYTPVKAGYTFKGWYTSANGGSLYNTVTVTSARTFYAQFTAASYTITWDKGDGTTAATSQTYGSALVLPTAPTRAGYTFDGWYTAKTGGTQVTGSTIYATQGASTYYAHWTAKSYTITWDKGDGTTVTTSQTYGERLTLPDTPARTGYTFDGWFTAETGGTQVTDSTTYSTASNTTYYAQWSGKEYTITWDLGDGTAETTQQAYGEKLVLPPTVPAKTGHTFDGWYTEETGGIKVTSDTVYTNASDVTYHAQFTPSQYTITWDLGDGRTETTSQTYGESLVLPATPLKDGYTFLGWFTAENGGTQVTTGTVYDTASASTYHAHWELIPVFSVTVPVVLPLAVAEDGTVHTAQGQAIRNSSTGAVRVTGVTLSAANGWSLVPFDTDMAREKVDARLVGFALNGAETRSSGSAQDLTISNDWTIPADESLPLEYDAVISALSQPVTDQSILSVVFILQWA